MNEKEFLTQHFEESRDHLRAVAYRMLGSAHEADDAVQETWLRLNRADTRDVENLRGWLTTVTARVCLDMLRSRKSHDTEPLEPESSDWKSNSSDPEQELLLARSVGLALLVVLETLSPAERVAFVLHDLFDLSFAEIAPIVGKTEDASRQLASRARRRVRGEKPSSPANIEQERELVDAFLAASRNGEFDALVSLLDPNVVFHADAIAMRGRSVEVRGAEAVANLYRGRAQGAGTALIDGAVGIIVAPLGKLMMLIRVTVANGKIAALDVVADPAKLSDADITVA